MKRVLFLCTGNSCRSQMAEGWMRSIGGAEYEVYSAGTRPMGINPLAVAAMSEAGVDISGQTSSHVDEYTGQEFALVITVCDNARESCPVFPGDTVSLHWGFDDPADATGSDDERMVVFRRVRDDIREKISHYLSSVRSNDRS